MRPPARAVVGHLVFGTEGRVWAVYRVEPEPFLHRGQGATLAFHSRVRALLMGVPADSMLLSVCERLSPDAVAAAMVEGIELDEHKEWGSHVGAALELMDRLHLFRRSHWLAFAVDEAGMSAVRAAIRSAAESVGARFGLAPNGVGAPELESRRRRADAIRRRLGSMTLREATAGEVRWLYARAVRRGLDEPFLDASWEPAARRLGEGGEEIVTSASVVPLVDAVFIEGGARDDADRPRHRRYLRVDSLEGTAYQALLVMADMPHDFAFPGGGGEWFSHLDAAPFPVDWCVRLHSVDNAEAQAKARRQHRQLIGQLDEYDGEVTGAPSTLAAAMEAVDEERAALAANPAERECQAAILFATWSDNLLDLEEQAGALQSMFQPADYGLARPTGGQLGLFRSMLPGAEPAVVCRDYTQFLLARDLAAGAPFVSTEVGDPRGALLGCSLDAGVFSPVLFDPAYGPSIDRSGSIGVCGALGSGKSYLAKLLCWATVARGGQVVTIDRTVTAEYVEFASVAPGRSEVVSLEAGSGVCLDPLRVFSGEDRRRVTLGFCTLLAAAAPRSLEGAALAEAVDDVAERRGSRLVDVIAELERLASMRDAPDADARAVARKLNHFARMGLGSLAFGEGEPLRLDADFIVFHAPGLSLPDRETLLHEHLAAQMLPEQVFAQALLYLVAAVARSVIFSDPRRFAAALYDEAWALTASPQGQALLLEGVRDGRKHNAACWIVSQSPRDLGEAELVDLLGSRFVFRQARGATGAALRFLGADDSTDLAELLEQRLGPGQCVMRDVRDRTGLIQVLGPLDDAQQRAFDTNPSRRAGAAVEPSSAERVSGPHAPPERRTRRRVMHARGGGAAR